MTVEEFITAMAESMAATKPLGLYFLTEERGGWCTVSGPLEVLSCMVCFTGKFLHSDNEIQLKQSFSDGSTCAVRRNLADLFLTRKDAARAALPKLVERRDALLKDIESIQQKVADLEKMIEEST